jgi:IS5 family transposase
MPDNAPASHRFRVFIQGQRRRVTDAIRHELKRRSAIEPVIGHMKADTGMGRCHLKGSQGDDINAVLAAVGFNFRLVLRWLAALLCALIAMAFVAIAGRQPQPSEA